MNNVDFMLIDDDPINNLIIQKEISKFDGNARILVYESASEALDYLKKNTDALPKLLLLDINMPGMNGWDFLQEFKASNLSTNVVIITSSIAKIDRDKSQNYPIVKDYFIKPLDKEDIHKIFAFIN